MDGKEEKGGGGGLKSKQWGASEIEINPHSCVSISEFELSKKEDDDERNLKIPQTLMPSLDDIFHHTCFTHSQTNQTLERKVPFLNRNESKVLALQ